MRFRRATFALLSAFALAALATPIAEASRHATASAPTAAAQSATPPAASLAGAPLPQLPEFSAVRSRATRADNRVLVRLKAAPSAEQIARAWKASGTSAGTAQKLPGGILAMTPPAGVSASELERRLSASGLVEYAAPNYLRQLAYTPPAFVSPNDPSYLDTTERYGTFWGMAMRFPLARSWWLRDVGALPATNGATGSAWQTALTGTDTVGTYPLRASGTTIKVGVIDSGVYTDHEDIGPNVVRATGDGPPADPSTVNLPTLGQRTAEVSHGTCVTGIIAAEANNGLGTLGLAADTKVIVYKVYFGGAGISDADIITAIGRAVTDGCKVINMSIAGGVNDPALQDAITRAWNAGRVVVAASGNESYPNPASVDYPGAMANVLAVGALTRASDGVTDVRAPYSNYGTALDISAPGTRIWGLNKPGYEDPYDPTDAVGYRWDDGTSMASPVVAGGIAFLWRAAPALTNWQLVDLVQKTARDMGSPGRDIVYGAGAFDLHAAYDRLIADYPHLVAPALDVAPSSTNATALATWSTVAGTSVNYDVWLDGTAILRATTTRSAVLDVRPRLSSLRYYRGRLLWSHSPADGHHVLTIVPKSIYNWTDGTEKASYSIDLPSGSPHIDRVSIDGKPSTETSHGVFSTAGLSLGVHRATVTVTDSLGNTGPAATVTFTVRPTPSVSRMVGGDRYASAVAASKAAFADGGAPAVVLASGAGWANALAAGPLGKSVRGPVLLTGAISMPAVTAAELVRLKTRTVLLVGGTASVSDSVKSWLTARGYRVVRISGTDRYTTANAIARTIAARQGGTLLGKRVVVVGDSYTDALAASAVAARKGWPLLYTPASGVRSSTRKTISAIGAKSTLLVARTVTVSAAAKAQLPVATRVSATTSLGVPTALAAWARAHYPADFSGERIVVASSTAYADSLGLGAFAGRGGWLVLCTPATLASEVRSYYVSHSEIAVTTRVMASSTNVSDATVAAIKGIVGAP